MELIRGVHNLRPDQRGCVATIGNFDGVHLGHQAVLGQLAEKSAELGLPSVVITFEPHPQEFFAPASSTPRLTSFREKIKALGRYAVDRVLCVNFGGAIAAMPAQEFVDRILVRGLDVRYLVVGDDFRFGYRRSGDIDMLRDAGVRHGFQVVNMHTFEINGERVSSTRIRTALARGDLATAEQLLGRSYRVAGRVVRGDQRGRTIGFPTANIHLRRRRLTVGLPACGVPMMGVFAVDVFGLEPEPVQGVANIGVRPTVDGQRCALEVHLLDFSADIYTRHIQVEFLCKLRDERRFDTIESLRKQIQLDVEQARDYFDRRPVTPSGVTAMR